MTPETDPSPPHAGEAREEPRDEKRPSGKAIPPLPEPNVEGVGEESGPSAGKTGLRGEPRASGRGQPSAQPHPTGTQPEHRDAEVKDADNPAAKPQGSTRDQIANMEAEGQAQPQADEQPPD